MNNSKFEIVAVEGPELEALAKRTSRVEVGKSSVQTAVLLRDNKEIGLAQVGLPAKRYQGYYTSELLRIVELEKMSFSEASTILRGYIDLYRPSDLMAKHQILEKYSALDLSLFGWVSSESVENYYEWIDPALTFYTYRITSTPAPSYYLGVSHVKLTDAAEKDCLNDGYWGSGGKRFQSWKKANNFQLKKEILGLFSRKAVAYAAEADLIGDRWKNDPNCLNSSPGGFFRIASRRVLPFRTCSTHGETKHRGDECCRCIAEREVSVQLCPAHGMVTHFSGHCLTCQRENSITMEECGKHGLVSHDGGVCYKCRGAGSVSMQSCAAHGVTTFVGKNCATCQSLKAFGLLLCETHGESLHQGSRCMKCALENTRRVSECKSHGSTIHFGDSCAKCAAKKRDRVDVCPKHGEGHFRKSSCTKCVNNSTITQSRCKTHGVVTHQAGRCGKCSALSKVSLKECKKHGVVKHTGISCYKCIWERLNTIKKCETHGNVRHQGNTCSKCSSQKMAHTRFHETPKDGCPHC